MHKDIPVVVATETVLFDDRLNPGLNNSHHYDISLVAVVFPHPQRHRSTVLLE